MNHKKLMNLGLSVSLESEKIPLGDTMIPAMQLDGENTLDTLDANRGLENIGLAIEHLNKVYGKLDNIRVSMLSNAAQGPLTKVSVEAYSQAIDNLIRPLGLSGVTVSAEGFAHDHNASLTYSEEGIKEVLTSLLRKIVELIGSAVEKGKVYIQKIFTGTANLEERLQALGQKLNQHNNEPTNATTSITRAEAEWITKVGGQPNAGDATIFYQRGLGAAVISQPRNVKTFLKEINHIVADWAQNPQKARHESWKTAQFPYRVNPKTGYDDDFNFGPYAIHATLDELPTIEFVARDIDTSDDDSEVQIPTMQIIPMRSNVSGLLSVLKTAHEYEPQYAEVTAELENFAKIMESLLAIKYDDDNEMLVMRDKIMHVNATVRSFADFPIRTAAKYMQGISALESIYSKMLKQGYGSKKTEGATGGTGPAATGATQGA